jgi:hypothetical protein
MTTFEVLFFVIVISSSVILLVAMKREINYRKRYWRKKGMIKQ